MGRGKENFEKKFKKNIFFWKNAWH